MFAESLPTATVVFREIIEIALVIGIVMAATRGMAGRLRMVFSGLGVGILGAVIIAFFTDKISQAVDGIGQEVFNAFLMFLAVICLAWTVIWMKKHGCQMAQNIKVIGQAVSEGHKSMYVLVGVIALATFREGAEIVLFSYAMGASGAIPIASIMMGGAVGAIAGTLLGAMFYLGLLKAAQRHLFTVTGWLLILLSAGMAAQGASFLIQADVLPALTTQVWDTSHILSGHSFAGKMLGTLVGYSPQPSGMEIVFYIGAFCLIGAAYIMMGRRHVSMAQHQNNGLSAVPAE